MGSAISLIFTQWPELSFELYIRKVVRANQMNVFPQNAELLLSGVLNENHLRPVLKKLSPVIRLHGHIETVPCTADGIFIYYARSPYTCSCLQDRSLATAGLLRPDLLHRIAVHDHRLEIAEVTDFGFAAIGWIPVARRAVRICRRFIDFVGDNAECLRRVGAVLDDAVPHVLSIILVRLVMTDKIVRRVVC